MFLFRGLRSRLKSEILGFCFLLKSFVSGQMVHQEGAFEFVLWCRKHDQMGRVQICSVALQGTGTWYPYQAYSLH
jgi:hypothetical protein